MVFFEGSNTYIEKDGLFDITKTFDCGQCFRFENENGVITGIAHGRKLCVREDEKYVILENVSEDEFDSVWKTYFDLDRDYGGINSFLSRDSEVKDCLNYAKGIRILRQDKWETLCSFIISQNNNIPRIKKIVSSLCTNFGAPTDGGFAFPDAKTVLDAGVDGLAVIRSGFRAKYIIDAAEKVVSGDVDLEKLAALSYDEAKEILMTIKGVGNKVADCVLLFGYGFFDAFPKDVWIKRVIQKYYGDGFDESVFKPYGGIAQQYLFYRERWIEKDSAPFGTESPTVNNRP